MFKRTIRQEAEDCDRERIRADIENQQDLNCYKTKDIDTRYRKTLLIKLRNAKQGEISALVNDGIKEGLSRLMLACMMGWSDLVRKLLTYTQSWMSTLVMLEQPTWLSNVTQLNVLQN